MYPNDQSISSYSSNPSTPVNSPPPLTQTPGTSLSIHNSTPSTSWQQLTPANALLNNPSTPVLNGIQNGQYAPELVHRGLHMVIITTLINSFQLIIMHFVNIQSSLFNFYSVHATTYKKKFFLSNTQNHIFYIFCVCFIHNIFIALVHSHFDFRAAAVLCVSTTC